MARLHYLSIYVGLIKKIRSFLFNYIKYKESYVHSNALLCVIHLIFFLP